MGSAVGGLFGLAGGIGGTGFAGPQNAPIQTPVSSQQATDSYKANQSALTQQQALLDAIKQQNGLQNQSSVYNQMQNIANGTGPNPAQAMLNQATGQNVANQAALMAGQRGANANIGLMARQAAQQGTSAQQDAAGQAAIMQAQQSLGALNNMGNLATTQAGQQIGATGAVTSGQQAEQQALLNAIAQQNNSEVGQQSNINNINATMAGAKMGQQGILMGSGLQGMAGGLMGTAAKAKGGPVEDPFTEQQKLMRESADENLKPGMPQLYDPRTGNNIMAPAQNVAGPTSKFGQFLTNTSKGGIGYALGNAMGSGIRNLFSSSPDNATNTPIGNSQAGGPSDVSQGQEQSDTFNAAKGGPVPAMVSPGEQYLSPKDVQKVKSGANPMQVGEKIPGKPKVGGAKNSYANDIVPKTLEEGGIVLPRSVTQSKNPHWAAHKFVQEVMRKQGKKK